MKKINLNIYEERVCDACKGVFYVPKNNRNNGRLPRNNKNIIYRGRNCKTCSSKCSRNIIK